MPVAFPLVLLPGRIDSGAGYTAGAVAIASCSSVAHMVQLVQDKEVVRLGDSVHTYCCRDWVECVDFGRQRIGSFACLRTLHFELPVLAAPRQPVVAPAAVVCSCLRISVALGHQVRATCSSSTSRSWAAQRDQ